MMSLNNEQEKNAALSILTTMLSLLGLSAEATVTDHDEQTIVSLRSEDPGRLIGRRGRVIENLEYLLNRSLSQRLEGAVKVRIDVDGYDGEKAEKGTGRRESGARPDEDPQEDSAWKEQYRKMAIDAAKEVRRWGGSKELGPFPARERRVIHLTLADDPEVKTESQGDNEEGLKKVIIHAVDETIN